MKIKFEELKVFLKEHWRLELRRADPTLKGRCRCGGAWKSGFIIEGILPGYRHSTYRFRTLKEIARRSKYKIK
jgi:hypothetical protein